MKRKKNIAVVHCSGGAKQNEGIDIAALPKDCNQILEQYPDGIHSCSYGCLGGGSCRLPASCTLSPSTRRGSLRLTGINVSDADSV